MFATDWRRWIKFPRCVSLTLSPCVCVCTYIKVWLKSKYSLYETTILKKKILIPTLIRLRIWSVSSSSTPRVMRINLASKKNNKFYFSKKKTNQISLPEKQQRELRKKEFVSKISLLKWRVVVMVVVFLFESIATPHYPTCNVSMFISIRNLFSLHIHFELLLLFIL